MIDQKNCGKFATNIELASSILVIYPIIYQMLVIMDQSAILN